ncbi:hypothetical protein Ciccas_006538, partial [Cichlidogyrus casuarinus]
VTEVVNSSSFTPDITPIILAAHRDNYQIIKLLLDRGDSIPKPHDLRCCCSKCVEANKTDSLRHSKSRINAYRALASPSLIALSSRDPILTAFELSWELKKLGKMENEFRNDYKKLADQCQQFATDLLEQTRSSDELAIVLNHGAVSSSPRLFSKSDDSAPTTNLARLRLAIQYKQKMFVAHPHCQQLLASLWYEGLPGFRRRSLIFKIAMIMGITFLFPVISISYLCIPRSSVGSILKKPFIKFLCHSASYLLFLLLLILAALSDEYRDETGPGDVTKPTPIECVIVLYIAGFMWQQIKNLYTEGLKNFISDWWNLLDFGTNSLYIATISLRFVAHVKLGNRSIKDRKIWGSDDPVLVSECLFAAANIFSTLKLVYIFTVDPQLGPLQISLGRMLNDILKFFCVYMLVLVAFACGLNQLNWFYARIRKAQCLHNQSYTHSSTFQHKELDKYNYCTSRGRYLSNLFEIVQTLYWSTYGLIELENFNLEYPHKFTEFIGKLMFGVYSYISLVVLVNMLIAMMNNSYQIIAEQSDVEWKFARSKLWVSYFGEGGTLPVPFNIVPSPKSILYILARLRNQICYSKQKSSRWECLKKMLHHQKELDNRHHKVVLQLVRRYLLHRQHTEERQGQVTEDDINEIKGDISAFRCELLDLLRQNNIIKRNGSESASIEAYPASSEYCAETFTSPVSSLRSRRSSKRTLSRLSLNWGTLEPAAEIEVSLDSEEEYSSEFDANCVSFERIDTIPNQQDTETSADEFPPKLSLKTVFKNSRLSTRETTKFVTFGQRVKTTQQLHSDAKDCNTRPDKRRRSDFV